MNMDHRRPLVAYVLVALVGAFVLAQGLARGAIDPGPGPQISALVDVTRTPSERAGELADGSTLAQAPLVTTPPEESSFLAPTLGVVDQMVGGLDYSAEDPGTTTTAAAVDEPAAGGSPDGDGSGQVVTASELVPTPGAGGAGSSQGGADGSRSGDGGLFGTPPSDDGPDPAGPGSEGQPSPAPHSFDNVPAHAHPYGHHVGPKPGKPDQAGQGKPDQAGQGKPDQAGQGKPDQAGQGKGKDKGATGQGKGNKGGKATNGNGGKGGKASNGKGGKGGKGKGKGHGKGTSKAHAPGWVKDGPR